VNLTGTVLLADRELTGPHTPADAARDLILLGPDSTRMSSPRGPEVRRSGARGPGQDLQ